jgi:outer membrane protein TolC
MVNGTKMKQLFILFFLCCTAIASAQESLLEQIEQNNTVLATLRKQAEADKIANKTGIYPENPEVEYHYLWGSPDAGGNRIDFSAVQRFDFPTSYYYKKKVADAQNKQVDLKYLSERKNVLLEAKKLCIRLIYQNALSKELAIRLQQAQQMAEVYQMRLNKGDVSVLDLNKAKINLLNVKKEYETSLVEKNFLTAELTRLNGGISIDYSVSEFSETLLPDSFEAWYESQKEKNLNLQYLAKETGLSRETEKLQRSLNLPKISAGYMSEKVLTERFQGITVGLSIPLWGNKNTVRQIKARTLAGQEAENDAAIRFRNESEALYKKALHLKGILNDYRQNALSDNTLALLKKALDAGEISLIDYLMESTIYYEVINNRLETERELHLAVAELMQWM